MKSLRRVLIVHPYGIGDLLFVTPVLRALRLIPTVEKVDMLLGSRTAAVVQGNPHVDGIRILDKDLYHRQNILKNLQDALRLGRELARERYELLLDYSLRGEFGFFGGVFLRIPVRAGFDYKGRGFFHTHRLRLDEGFKDRHVADFFCDLAERAGVKVENRFLEYYSGPEDRAAAQEILETHLPKSGGPFLVASAGGGESWGRDAHFKRWPVPYFAELIEKLSKRLGAAAIFLVGSPGESALHEELKSLLKSLCVNLTGRISLNVSAALLERADLFVGNDGGLMHLAHSLQTPAIAFFGPVDPGVYGPYPPSLRAISLYKRDLDCRPCYRKFRYNSACIGRECLQDLKPEEAWEMLEERNFLNAFETGRLRA